MMSTGGLVTKEQHPRLRLELIVLSRLILFIVEIHADAALLVGSLVSF
jgi:hypothetical protein